MILFWVKVKVLAGSSFVDLFLYSCKYCCDVFERWCWVVNIWELLIGDWDEDWFSGRNWIGQVYIDEAGVWGAAGRERWCEICCDCEYVQGVNCNRGCAQGADMGEEKTSAILLATRIQCVWINDTHLVLIACDYQPTLIHFVQMKAVQQMGCNWMAFLMTGMAVIAASFHQSCITFATLPTSVGNNRSSLTTLKMASAVTSHIHMWHSSVWHKPISLLGWQTNFLRHKQTWASMFMPPLTPALQCLP